MVALKTELRLEPVQRDLLVLAIWVVDLLVATKVGDDGEVTTATGVIAGIGWKIHVSLIRRERWTAGKG